MKNLKTVFDDEEKDVATASGSYSNGYVTQAANINLYSIYDVLLAATGRFCERNLYDIVYTFQEIDKTLKDTSFLSVGEGESHSVYFFFGIYKSGIDHERFIENNRDKWEKYSNWGAKTNYYRSVYGMKLTVSRDKDCSISDITAVLRDLTNSI